MRHLATIRTISELRPIPNADRIEVAQVDGWECVVAKGEFHTGDTIVYIEVDSVCPEKPEFEFLRERKFRVKTIKLRGQVSQGLVLPISILPEGKKYQVGDDVTEVLGITKYDPQAVEEKSLVQQGKRRRFRNIFGGATKRAKFPDWIAKTDEERIQNLVGLFERERGAGTEFSVTEKVDGCSATYYLKKRRFRRPEFGVCSRNMQLHDRDNSAYWKVAEQYDMENVLKKLIGKNSRVVLQGEICGNKIQGNKYKIDGYRLFVFNLIFTDKHGVQKVCRTLEIADRFQKAGVCLETVPMVGEHIKLPDTIAELVEFSKGKSVVNKKQKREGVVMRTEGVSFKVINPDFLLAEKD